MGPIIRPGPIQQGGGRFDGRAGAHDAPDMLKIIGGEFRSRVLRSPPGDETTRPYLARVRESVFNLLRGWCEDASVLDLFAGVGTVGLEAASRGARTVVLVERDRRLFELMQTNIDALGCGDRVQAVHGDALSPVTIARAAAPVDLVFVDPPYPMMREPASRERVLRQIEACRSIMGEQGFVVLRSPLGPDDADWAIPGFDGPEAHRYGPTMWVLLYAPATGDDPDRDPGSARADRSGGS
jgi:16S rRNA (guanine966-N2)-methyltransferase